MKPRLVDPFVRRRPSRQFACRFLLLLFLAGTAPAEEQNRLEESLARERFLEYLNTKSLTPGEVEISLRPFGKRAWLISYSLVGTLHVPPRTYVMHPRIQGFPEISCEVATDLLAAEYENVYTDAERSELFAAFIKLNSLGAVISSTSDIPGYDTARLAPDLQASLRAPYAIDYDADHVKRPTRGGKAYVMYTYQRRGGKVTRVQLDFSSEGGLKRAHCLILATEIGQAMQIIY